MPSLSSIPGCIPWWAKIGAKLVLARLPVSYGFWKSLGLFEHGLMEDPPYAYGVFMRHFEKCGKPEKGFVGLELGPGDSLASALIAHAFGAAGYYLVDAGPFAIMRMEPYHAMAALLVEKGLPIPQSEELMSLERMLTACHATYTTAGFSSLCQIPDEYVDFIWSHAVLEHIRAAEFLEIMRELRRIIRPGGICSHRVDLKDHLGGALNNLRFSDRIWESSIMAAAGFYTNRIQYSAMLDLFKQAGFSSEVVTIDRWNKLPTPKAKLHPRFRALPDNELCISGFDAVLRPL